MTRYDIGGMSCAACSARVEKAVNGVEGVGSCSVSLLTNSMTVEGSAIDVDANGVVTGYDSVPWYIRYVGVDPAQAMKNQNLALEEYVEMLGR